MQQIVRFTESDEKTFTIGDLTLVMARKKKTTARFSGENREGKKLQNFLLIAPSFEVDFLC